MSINHQLFLRMIKKYLSMLFVLSTILFIQGHVYGQEDDEKWINLLRDFADDLDWSTGVFVSDLDDKQSRIFGISDKPFSTINQENEKQLVQIITGPEQTLKDLYQGHRKDLEQAEFVVLSLPGSDILAFRAYSPYYVLD
ncbi:MAG: hypothetical protein Q8Q33_07440, partial [Chlamydiota bacterium]|nr:hypothetical protein [Chlamydiota bacterium]